jgi:tRNA(fMet)-specific endonuclease VapC
MIHLDTNVVIALLNGRNPAVRARFDAILATRTGVAMSVIVYHELMYGAAHSARRQANEDKIALFVAGARIALLPFAESDAAMAAHIRAHLRHSAAPIGPYDVLIAAQALCAGATLITANTREFQRVPGLSVTDWTV